MCRRQTIILQSAKQKEEEELAQCTFQPAIPRESEALAVKAFAHEYQHFLEEQRGYQHLESSDGDGVEAAANGDLREEETSNLLQRSVEKIDEEVCVAGSLGMGLAGRRDGLEGAHSPTCLSPAVAVP
jgi:hypothetical protein